MIGGMAILLRLRRAVARRLPEPAKRILRRVLPARLVARRPQVRRFSLAMPVPPSGLGPAVRPAAEPARVAVEAPWRSYVPRLLEESGVAGYEPETTAAFLAAISLGDATEAFDVGANVGIFSIIAATTTLARVTGFEPTPQLAETFGTIAAANGLSCTVEPIALGGQTGVATLYLSAKTDSSNSLKAGHRAATGMVEVPVERLDDYVARTGRRPGVMKIDTETTEPDVLAGGMETLRTVRPWVVCEVLAGTTEAALASILRPLGYRFHHLGDVPVPVEVDEIVGDPTWLHRDWLFTPEPLPPAFATHYAAWLGAIRATP
jgi:FkbM family methyltransferase